MIIELNKLASEMVGDGNKTEPNVYFVTKRGDVVGIYTEFWEAYDRWRAISWGKQYETTLEDRRFGCICSIEPESDEPGAKLIRIDDSEEFKKMYCKP